MVGVLLQLGSRGIHQDTVDDLLPDPKTRHVAAQVNLLKDKIKLEVREVIIFMTLAICCFMFFITRLLLNMAAELRQILDG